MQTLKQVVKELANKRQHTLEAVGEVIGIAAKAGVIIAEARASGQDIAKLLDTAGLTDEQGKRLERVAAHQHKLSTGEPSVVRQVMLWAEMLPDPITTSVPSERKPFMWPLIKVSQWFANRSKHQAWSKETKQEFMRYAEPIAIKYREIKEAALE
jgi:hypothetical protein